MRSWRESGFIRIAGVTDRSSSVTLSLRRLDGFETRRTVLIVAAPDFARHVIVEWRPIDHLKGIGPNQVTVGGPMCLDLLSDRENKTESRP